LSPKRRRRLTEASAAHLADLYRPLPLLTDAPPLPAIASSIRRIAIAHSLSAYDATYLELAQRLGSRLATLDQDPARTAAKSGAPLFLAETRR
jgi:predicted nucleic acid-binding protein